MLSDQSLCTIIGVGWLVFAVLQSAFFPIIRPNNRAVFLLWRPWSLGRLLQRLAYEVPALTVQTLKCPWARHWTLHCSQLAAHWHFEHVLPCEALRTLSRCEEVQKRVQSIYSKTLLWCNSSSVSVSVQRQRTVYRLTLVKAWNVEEMQAYSELIALGQPDFIEVKVKRSAENALVLSFTNIKVFMYLQKQLLTECTPWVCLRSCHTYPGMAVL